MSVDYIPQQDANFNTWQDNFLTYAVANTAALGLVPADLTPLTTVQGTWETNYAAHIAAQAAAEAASVNKDSVRSVFVSLIRQLVNRLQTSSSVTDAEKASLGITIRSTTRTPVTAPTTRPVLTADTSQRLQISIAFTDESTPTSKAKPDGVRGCEIYVKIGGVPPLDLSECTYLATDSRTPYPAEFDGGDGGKLAHFIGRWVSTRGEAGPMSETVSATITA